MSKPAEDKALIMLKEEVFRSFSVSRLHIIAAIIIPCYRFNNQLGPKRAFVQHTSEI